MAIVSATVNFTSETTIATLHAENQKSTCASVLRQIFDSFSTYTFSYCLLSSSMNVRNLLEYKVAYDKGVYGPLICNVHNAMRSGF